MGHETDSGLGELLEILQKEMTEAKLKGAPILSVWEKMEQVFDEENASLAASLIPQVIQGMFEVFERDLDEVDRLLAPSKWLRYWKEA